MSDDLFQRPKKKEENATLSKSQTTQKIDEMDLFGDIEKKENSTKDSKSNTKHLQNKNVSDNFQNIPNDVLNFSDDAFSMDDDLSSLFHHSENSSQEAAASDEALATDKELNSKAVASSKALATDKELNSKAAVISEEALATNKELNSKVVASEEKTSKHIDLYANTKNKQAKGYKIPNDKNTFNNDDGNILNADNETTSINRNNGNGNTSTNRSRANAKHFSQEKTSFADVSMKTRSSKVGDYIDKIKEKLATEAPGEKLNKTKDENGDEVTIEDKIYTGLETGCNVALDLMEGAGENLAFRFKRGVTSLFSSFQNKMLKKKFKRNDNIIQFGDFMFYEMGDELMLYKYVGINTEIKIPSYVEGMPVSYLDKNFLRFNAIKSIGRGLSIDRIQDVSIESIKDNLLNIKSVQLPNTLKILPSKVFAGCKRIDELVIPASVKIVQPNAFVGCRPTRIIFLGKAPRQLQDSNLAKVRIYCKKEYFDSFFRLMRNYDDYITDKNVKKQYLSLRKKILGSEDTAIWERMKRATDISDESLVH